MVKCNEELRHAAEEKGVLLWQIADRLGISDSTFSRWLRHELAPELKEQLLNIINDLEVK